MVNKTPASGRKYKDDGTIINTAEMIEAIYNSLVVDKDAGVTLTGSNVAQPTDLQSRYSQTIQTHNAVSVGASGSSIGTWIDTEGFAKLAITFANDNSTGSKINIHWSNDASSIHGFDDSVGGTTMSQQKTGIVDTKARYARLALFNTDTVAHTMSAWAYLKV